MCCASRDGASGTSDIVGGQVDEYEHEGDGEDGEREQDEENKVMEKVINDQDGREEIAQTLECRDVNGRPPLTESMTAIFPGGLQRIEEDG